MLLVSKATPQSPRNYVLTHLLAVLCENDIMEYAYYAELAGLRFQLSHDQLGMVLTLRGRLNVRRVHSGGVHCNR
jgi:secreted Zn-dependent insulinase-like peptidase